MCNFFLILAYNVCCLVQCKYLSCGLFYYCIAYYTLIDGEGEGFKSDPLVSSIFDADTTLSTLSLELIDEEPEEDPEDDESLVLKIYLYVNITLAEENHVNIGIILIKSCYM